MTNTRKELSELFQTGTISTENIDHALISAGITPNQLDWKNFLSNLLLWLGALSLANSVVFFIAYNWNDLGRFAKFGLVEALMALSIFIYWKSNKSKTDTANSNLVSKASLLVATIFLGVLLAFFGQTYQTGADTWQLFVIWSVLIIPWVLLSHFPALWILWLALINISIVLYYQTFSSVFGVFLTSKTAVFWAIIILNGSAFIIWELLKNRFSWLSESWAPRLLAFASGAPLTFLVLETVFNRHNNNILPALFWLLGITLIYWIYRKLKPDVFMLAMACLSGIIVLVSALSKVLIEYIGSDIFSFLLLTIAVLALGGVTAVWLKRVYQEQHDTQKIKNTINKDGTEGLQP